MIIYGLGSLGTVVSPFTDGEGVDGDSHDFATWFETGSAGVTAILIGIGLAVRRRSRIASYRWFKAGILVSLLITQVFVFYYDQLSALVGVIVDLLLYAALSVHDRPRGGPRAGPGAGAAPPLRFRAGLRDDVAGRGWRPGARARAASRSATSSSSPRGYRLGEPGEARSRSRRCSSAATR